MTRRKRISVMPMMLLMLVLMVLMAVMMKMKMKMKMKYDADQKDNADESDDDNDNNSGADDMLWAVIADRRKRCGIGSRHTINKCRPSATISLNLVRWRPISTANRCLSA
eukprot:52121-Rhodomonas_salina.4